MFDENSKLWKDFSVYQLVPAACIQSHLANTPENSHDIFSSNIEQDRIARKERKISKQNSIITIKKFGNPDFTVGERLERFIINQA